MSTEQPTPEEDAHKRGYAKGYAAGRKNLEAKEPRAEFRRAVFLAILPHIGNGWKNGDIPVSTTAKGQVKIAWDFADEAMSRAQF